jgi:Tfp pilus assembly protein PilN
MATTTIRDFRNRPAALWGAELERFVSAAGESRLAAVVLLPRSEVVVRMLSLPGVADKDIANAVELQIDTLHPWGDAEVAWGWAHAGQASDVLIGLTRQETLGHYETLFAEAGVPLAAATFSPAVIHAALRIWNAPPRAVLAIDTDENGRTEVYGESESRAVFSAEFSVAAARALALARAELRLPADQPATSLAEVLPGGARANAFAYAAAVAGSAPRAGRFANLLPVERRASHDRVQYLIPGALGVLVLAALVTAFVVFPAVEQRRLREELDRATRQLEPAAARARGLERTIAQNGSRIRLLDEIRRRPQADLEVLNELTRILPPTVWTNAIEIHPDSVVIAGEADQAAPLLKLLDSSPLFQNSEFVLAFTRAGETEQFRIRTMRRGRAGRQTP